MRVRSVTVVSLVRRVSLVECVTVVSLVRRVWCVIVVKLIVRSRRRVKLLLLITKLRKLNLQLADYWLGPLPPVEEMPRHCEWVVGDTHTHTTYTSSYHIHPACSVSGALEERGWVRCDDHTSTSFTLKWTELKCHIDYKLFREGEQVVNHFPNINLLTTKTGLLESLRSYCKIHRYVSLCMHAWSYKSCL